MDVTPTPTAFEALRWASRIQNLCKEDGPRRFNEVMEKNYDGYCCELLEIQALNPWCPCRAMRMLDADRVRHYCTYPHATGLKLVYSRARDST
jgi:hypothetical protein